MYHVLTTRIEKLIMKTISDQPNYSDPNNDYRRGLSTSYKYVFFSSFNFKFIGK